MSKEHHSTMYRRIFLSLFMCASLLGALLVAGCVNWPTTQTTNVANTSSVTAVQTDRGLLLILEAVYFDFNSAHLNPSAMTVIDEIANMIQSYPNSHIAIDGYTDNTGTERYNLHLSTERAESVKAALVQRNIAADRITAQGFGPDNPIADNTSTEGRQRNRRVEIFILKPIDIPTQKEKED